MKNTTPALSGFKPLFFLVCFFSIHFLNAQVPGDWQFAKQAGGNNADAGNSIAIDAAGNSYVAGYFDLASTFYGTPNITLNTNGGTDIFVAKYDPNGSVLWAVKAGGSSTDQALGINIDNSGNSYVTGYFSDTATFYGVTNIQLISNGGYDIFIAKFDPNGNVLWAKKAGGSGSDYGYKIKTDGTGNSFITGFFPNDTVVFYGTPNRMITSNGVNDMFIAKFDPSGNVLWAKSAGGTGNDFAYSIALDGAGNEYITGTCSNTCYFYGAALDSIISQGGNDIFVAKYDGNGNVLWVRQGGSFLTDQGSSVTVDASSNVYITGNSSNSCTFFGPPSSILLPSNGLSDIFIASYTSSGILRWAKHAGGSSGDFANSIDAGSNHNITISGYFSATATFYGTTNIIMTSSGSGDIYVAQYDTLGNVLCAQQAGGSVLDRGWDVKSDASGNCYLTGIFTGTATFPSTPAITLTAPGSASDILIGKWNTSCAVTTGIAPSEAEQEVLLYPNPATTSITIELKGNFSSDETQFLMYDILGKQLNNVKITAGQGTNTNASIDVSSLSKGMYFLKIVNGTKQIEKKFITE